MFFNFLNFQNNYCYWKKLLAISLPRSNELRMIDSISINPLLHEFSLPSIFEIFQSSVDFWRQVPIVCRLLDAGLRNFFPWSLLILKSKFLPNIVPRPLYAAKGYNFLLQVILCSLMISLHVWTRLWKSFTTSEFLFSIGNIALYCQSSKRPQNSTLAICNPTVPTHAMSLFFPHCLLNECWFFYSTRFKLPN